ncbi:hypothetical protein [Kribbella endophytica]
MLDWLRRRFAGAKGPVEQGPDVIREAWLLAEQGEVDRAADLLRGVDDAKHRGVLVLLLRKYGRLDEAIRLLEADPDADQARLRQFVGERGAELVQLTRGLNIGIYPPEKTTAIDDLLLNGQLDEAVEQLKASRLPADRPRLLTLLRELGRTDELRSLADNSVRLATLRAEERADDLRPLADGGDDEARVLLIQTLAKQGEVEELTALAAGDEYATGLLVELLGRLERVEELRPYVAAGNTRARDLLVGLLVRQERVDELRSLGDPYADGKLAELLAGLDRVEEAVAVLRGRAEASGAEQDWYELARLLADHGRQDEAIAVLRDGPRAAPDLLVELLTGRGRVDEALKVLDASDQRGAPRRAARLRAAHGLVDELRARADAGEGPSVEVLAAYLADQGEIDELCRRSAVADQQVTDAAPAADAGKPTGADRPPAAGDLRAGRIFGNQLVRALGRLRRLDELAELAGGGDRMAGLTWWAAVLADAEDVPAALAEHAAYSTWYGDEGRMRGVIDLLVEQARIGTAVEFAQARVEAGDAWASAWAPQQDRPGLSSYDDMLATKVEAAVRELLPGEADGQEHATTARIADEGSSYYGDVRVSIPALGHVRISLACWLVGTDTARYLGDDPPTEAERMLPPDGTAITDLRSTVGVLDELAIRLNAIDPPVPHPGGRHLTISVPLRTAPLTAVPD